MSLIDVALDAELRSAFMDAELRFLNAVAEDDRRGTFQTEFRSITQRAEAAMASNLLSLETVDLIRSVVASIRATAMRFMEGCNATARLESQIVNQWKSILGARLQTSARTPTAPSKRVKQHHIDSVTAEMTKYRPCRDYFLSHLGAPYPTAADKKQMAAKIGCEVASVSQWFTNHRRRSSWMSVMKDFANNDKGTMQRLVQTVISPDPSTPDVDVPDEARRAVSNVRAYFEKITAPTVSEEFMEMVSQPPMSDEELAAYRARRKQIRRVRMEAKRALAAKFAAKHGEGVKVAERAVPLVGKRKRNSEDTPPDEDERPRKRRGALAQIKVLISRDPNIRFVVKEDGTVRRLRRKGPLQSIGHNIPSAKKITIQNTYIPSHPSKAIPLDSACLRINKKRKAADEVGEASMPEPRLPTTHKRRRPNLAPVRKSSSVASISSPSLASLSPSPSPSLLVEQRSASAPNISALENEWNRMVSAPAQLSLFPQTTAVADNLIPASQVNAYLASMGIPVVQPPEAYGYPQPTPQVAATFSPDQSALVQSYAPTATDPSQLPVSQNYLAIPAYEASPRPPSVSWTSSSSEAASPSSVPFIGSLHESTFIDSSFFSSAPQPPPVVPIPQEALQEVIEAQRRVYEAKVQALEAQLALAQAQAQTSVQAL